RAVGRGDPVVVAETPVAADERPHLEPVELDPLIGQHLGRHDPRRAGTNHTGPSDDSVSPGTLLNPIGGGEDWGPSLVHENHRGGGFHARVPALIYESRHSVLVNRACSLAGVGGSRDGADTKSPSRRRGRVTDRGP